MRHLKKGKKFHRKTGQRRAFLRGLVSGLIRTGRVETTEARAKAIRPILEKMLTMAKKGTLASRRMLVARLQDQMAVRKLCDELGPRYKERKGGYLRIIKTAKWRKRDGAGVAVIEFV